MDGSGMNQKICNNQKRQQCRQNRVKPQKHAGTCPLERRLREEEHSGKEENGTKDCQ